MRDHKTNQNNIPLAVDFMLTFNDAEFWNIPNEVEPNTKQKEVNKNGKNNY